jgi:hypothetical protein
MALSNFLTSSLQTFVISGVIALIFIFLVWPLLRRTGGNISHSYNHLRASFGNALSHMKNLSKNEKLEAQQEFQSRIHADDIKDSIQVASSMIKKSNAFTQEDVKELRSIIGGTIQTINEEEEREKSLIERYNKDRKEINNTIADLCRTIAESSEERNNIIRVAQNLEKFNQNDSNLVKLIDIENTLDKSLNLLKGFEQKDTATLERITSLSRDSVKIIENLLSSLSDLLSLTQRNPVFQQLPEIKRGLDSALEKAKVYSSIKENIINLIRERTASCTGMQKLFEDSYAMIEEQKQLIYLIQSHVNQLRAEGKVDNAAQQLAA